MQQAERLRAIRKLLGISQQNFADSLGLKQGSYSDIERGKTKGISDSVLKLISNIYNVNIDYILTGEGEMLKRQATTSVLANLGNDNNYVNVGSEINSAVAEPAVEYLSKEDTKKIQKLESRIIELETMLRAKDEFIKAKDDIIKAKDDLIKVLNGK